MDTKATTEHVSLLIDELERLSDLVYGMGLTLGCCGYIADQDKATEAHAQAHALIHSIKTEGDKS